MADAVNTRAHPRVPIEAFVRLAGEHGEWVLKTRDISEAGLFLYTRLALAYPFKVGSTLDIELFHEGEEIRCQVVVVRAVAEGTPEAARYPTGFAVRIVSIAAADRERLQALIAGK